MQSLARCVFQRCEFSFRGNSYSCCFLINLLYLKYLSRHKTKMKSVVAFLPIYSDFVINVWKNMLVGICLTQEKGKYWNKEEYWRVTSAHHLLFARSCKLFEKVRWKVLYSQCSCGNSLPKNRTYHGIRILRGFQWKKKVISSWDLSQPYNKER